MKKQQHQDISNVLVILVGGSTGHTGSACVHELAMHPFVHVKALCMDPNDAEAQMLAIHRNVELVKGNYSDKASLLDAAKGCNRAFLASPMDTLAQAEHEINFLEAAKEAGVEVTVRISGPSPIVGKDDPTMWGRSHAKIEDWVQENDAFVISLHPDMYMENQLWHAKEARVTGRIRYPMKTNEPHFAFVRAADVGKCAARALMAALPALRPFRGQAVEIHGPGLYSFDDMMALISKHVGYEIRCEMVDKKVYANILKQEYGWTQWCADSYTLMLLEMAGSEGSKAYIHENDRLFAKIAGAPTTTLDQYISTSLKACFCRMRSEPGQECCS